MKTICTLLLFVLSGTAFSQASLFRTYTLNDEKLKSFDIHLATSDSTLSKPLLVYLDGSGNFPAYYKTTSGRMSTTVPLSIKQYMKDYHIVLISKPGVPLSDSLRTSPSGRAYYPESDSYKTLYSLDWRAGAAAKAVDFLLQKLPVNKERVVVMGYSEGSQVAPAVAMRNKNVTHIVCVAGNALNQLFDFLIRARVAAEKGEITTDEGQRRVDSLYGEYEKIYADPLSTTKKWYGETYLKWSSYTQTTPLENMLKLNIPILYIAGGKDNHQSIISMDYAWLEFLRKGKKNLWYKVYPAANHFFQETEIKEGKTTKVDRIDEVHAFALEWTASH